MFTADVGLAHMVRSLAIADELFERGHRPILAIPQRNQETKFSTKAEVVDIPPSTPENNFTDILKIKDPEYIAKLVGDELDLIQKYKPDIIVSDARHSVFASSAITNTPVVYIINSAGLPYGCYLPNFGLPQIVYRAVVPALNKLIWKTKYLFYKTIADSAMSFDKTLNVEDMLQRVNCLVPEIPEYLPHNNAPHNIFYSGPIIWKGLEKEEPPWFQALKTDPPTVYLSFGGTGFDEPRMIAISTQLISEGFQVVVSTGTVADKSNFPEHENLFVEKYVPGYKICQRADAIICQGGYGTLSQVFAAGKPAVTLPYNPDQLIHSLRMTELGTGINTLHISLKDIFTFIRVDKEGGLDAMARIAAKVSNKEIIDALKKVLNNPQAYKLNIHKFTGNLSEYQGAENAAQIIEKIIP